MTEYDALLKPLRIKGLTLRNRVMSSSHAPGYLEGGVPGEQFTRYHVEKAKGGIALTVVGSSSAAHDSPAGPYGIIRLTDDSVITPLRAFTDAVHAAGAAAMIQIVQAGRRMHWDSENWLPLLAPSPVRERAHRAFPKVVEEFDIKRIVRDFAAAARRCEEAGFDGIELSNAHLHIVDQFWSPLVNKRTDGYGGSFENRMRLGVEVLEAMRAAVGESTIIGMRMSGDELIEGGNGPEECLAIARFHAERGLVDFINVMGAQATTLRYFTYAIPNITFPAAPYLALASAVRREVNVPVFQAQKIADVATAARAVADGHVDMVGMTRAHIADPHIVRKIEEGRPEDIRPCVGASYCVSRVGIGHEALCMHNAATGREATIPHRFPKASRARRVVVAGGGPGGLEAARVAAERGHDVVLFEAEARTGGQINLAAAVPWRETLRGIPDWLQAQAKKLGAEIRVGTRATAEMVLAESPDVVVIATGGRPNKGDFEGADLALTSWEAISDAATATAGESILVYDDSGHSPGVTCAEVLARHGARVELISPDRLVGEDVGMFDRPAHMRHLHEREVVMTPDFRLLAVRREGNRLLAVLANEYTDAEEERLVDRVVAEHGILPNDDLYLALKPLSRNLGELDHDAYVAGAAQGIEANPEGSFQLFRVGDALAGRNVHAAIYDGLRVAKDL